MDIRLGLHLSVMRQERSIDGTSMDEAQFKFCLELLRRVRLKHIICSVRYRFVLIIGCDVHGGIVVPRVALSSDRLLGLLFIFSVTICINRII